MEILITERTDITPLLCMDWMKKFKLTIRRIQLAENNQSEREKIFNKFPDLFENHDTIKDTEINIQLKPGHYPVKQKARPIPLQLLLRSSGKSNTNAQKSNNSKPGRRKRHNRKRKESVTGYAIYNTTGLKITPFELHHGRKPRTELTNIVKDGKTYLSNWSEMPISAPTRPKIPIYVGRDADGEITNHMVMAKTKAEEKQLTENQKSPKKKSSVRYPFKFVEKNYNKKSLEGRFQNKIQTAVSGTESTIKTATGKIINRKFISGPLFQTERKARKEPAINTSGEINPKNRHCLRGLNGKYGR